jgi:hypothetical protein
MFGFTFTDDVISALLLAWLGEVSPCVYHTTRMGIKPPSRSAVPIRAGSCVAFPRADAFPGPLRKKGDALAASPRSLAYVLLFLYPARENIDTRPADRATTHPALHPARSLSFPRCGPKLDVLYLSLFSIHNAEPAALTLHFALSTWHFCYLFSVSTRILLASLTATLR